MNAKVVELTEEERTWVQLKWKKIRTSQQAADKAGNEWNKLNRSIDKFLDDSNIHDVVQRSHRKKESLALQDAYDAGKWHSAESMRHIADVDLFLKMRELGVL